MLVLHTADWHLGRTFYRRRLLEDQAHVLAQIVDVAKQAKPDAIIIAGDIYDRAVPPPDAVALLDEVLGDLAALGAPVLMISGNHDSPHRLGFGASLFERHNVFVRTALSRVNEPVRVEARKRTLDIFAIPYAEPAFVRQWQRDVEGHEEGRAESNGRAEDADAKDVKATASSVGASTSRVGTHDEALHALVSTIDPRSQTDFRIATAHLTLTGGKTSESERVLAASGREAVEPTTLGGFDYVALGHLHIPQNIGGPSHRYAGSPLCYSFGEGHQADAETAPTPKSLTLVELDTTRRTPKLEIVSLSPLHPVRRVRGSLQELLGGVGSTDYVEATLTDKGPVFDAMGRLRTRFPNILHLARDTGERPLDEMAMREVPENVTSQRIGALFSRFYEEMTGAPLNDPDLALIHTLEDELASDSEATPT